MQPTYACLIICVAFVVGGQCATFTVSSANIDKDRQSEDIQGLSLTMELDDLGHLNWYHDGTEMPTLGSINCAEGETVTFDSLGVAYCQTICSRINTNCSATLYFAKTSATTNAEISTTITLEMGAYIRNFTRYLEDYPALPDGARVSRIDIQAPCRISLCNTTNFDVTCVNYNTFGSTERSYVFHDPLYDPTGHLFDTAPQGSITRSVKVDCEEIYLLPGVETFQDCDYTHERLGWNGGLECQNDTDTLRDWAGCTGGENIFEYITGTTYRCVAEKDAYPDAFDSCGNNTAPRVSTTQTDCPSVPLDTDQIGDLNCPSGSTIQLMDWNGQQRWVCRSPSTPYGNWDNADLDDLRHFACDQGEILHHSKGIFYCDTYEANFTDDADMTDSSEKTLKYDGLLVLTDAPDDIQIFGIGITGCFETVKFQPNMGKSEELLSLFQLALPQWSNGQVHSVTVTLSRPLFANEQIRFRITVNGVEQIDEDGAPLATLWVLQDSALGLSRTWTFNESPSSNNALAFRAGDFVGINSYSYITGDLSPGIDHPYTPSIEANVGLFVTA